MKKTNDPLERMLADTLDFCGIEYVCPDQMSVKDLAQYGIGAAGGNRLDFYLPKLKIYIECKAYGTDRIHRQVENVSNCIVLIGMVATRFYCDLLLLQYKTR